MLVGFAVGVIALLCGSDPAKGQSPFEVSIALTTGTVYPASQWIPLRVEMRNGSDSGIDGEVRIAVSLKVVSTEFRVPASVPPRSRVAVTAFAYLPDSPLNRPGAVGGGGVNVVAVAEWVGTDGARLARAELLGQPDSVRTDGTNEVAAPFGSLLLWVYDSETTDAREVFQVPRLAEFINAQNSFPLITGAIDLSALPRHVAGFGAVKAVILNGFSPDAMDYAQRNALKAYLLSGGILILPAPLDDADPTGSWIDGLLPVATIGRREANAIRPSGAVAGPMMSADQVQDVGLRETVELCEAVDAGSEVLLRDADYVHVAIKRIGLGRVVFTSFPINALDPADARTLLLWRGILELDRPSQDWTGSALQVERDPILESLIGTPAAPWSHAAMIAGGYMVLMLLSQLLFPGARRPAAFAIGASLAIVVCAGILAFASQWRSDNGSFSAARLATIDLGESGGGVRREAIVFLGRDDPGFSISTTDSVTLRPVVAGADAPAVLTQLPFAAPNAGVRSGRVDRVWEATESVPEEVGLVASVQFETHGVRLYIDNRLEAEVGAPVVLWNRGCYRLEAVPEGKSDVLLGPKNLTGDFTNVSVIAGEEAALRARIVQSSVLPAANSRVAPIDDMQPMLVGWLDPHASDLAKPLAMLSAPPDPIRAQVMVRSPIRIVASSPGQTIHIASDHVRVVGGAGQRVFYDEVLKEWLQSLQTGSWMIGFQAPEQIGRIRPIRATISTDLMAPGHRITLRRGQSVDGVARENADGAIVADWDRAVGPRSVSFDLEAADADASGCVWMRLSVHEADSSGNVGVLAQWKINRFAMELTAQVEAD